MDKLLVHKVGAGLCKVNGILKLRVVLVAPQLSPC